MWSQKIIKKKKYYKNCIKVFFYIIGIGVVVQSTVTIKQESNLCSGYRNGDRFRNLRDCSKYYECLHGQPILNTCWSTLRFSDRTRNCEPASEVQCFECPKDEYFIEMPVDYNCMQFIRCFANHASQHSCEYGLLFDPVHRTCNFERNVTCSCPITDIPSRPLFIRDRSDCAK